jgi:hypothetical protein
MGLPCIHARPAVNSLWGANLNTSQPRRSTANLEPIKRVRRVGFEMMHRLLFFFLCVPLFAQQTDCAFELSRADVRKMTWWYAKVLAKDKGAIRLTFRELASDSSRKGTSSWFTHPLFGRMVTWLADGAVQHPYLLPFDDDVDHAYQKALSHIEDVNLYCRVCADAAGYFYWRKKFSYIRKYLETAERTGCDIDVSDFRKGYPQPPFKYRIRGEY